MKKKMSILSALVLAVTVTAYSVSGTYAKYTSAIDFADDARVAKWSFDKVGGNNAAEYELDLFAKSYKLDGETKNWVSAFNNDNVVAPGTTGTTTMQLNASIETAFTVDYTMSAVNDFVVYYSTVADDATKVDKMAKTKAELMALGVAETDVKEYRPLKYSVVYKNAGKTVFDTAVSKDGFVGDPKGITANALQGALDTYNANNWSLTNRTGHYFTPSENRVLTFDITWNWYTNNTEGSLKPTEVNRLDTFAGQNLSTQKITFKLGVVANQVADDSSKPAA